MSQLGGSCYGTHDTPEDPRPVYHSNGQLKACACGAQVLLEHGDEVCSEGCVDVDGSGYWQSKPYGSSHSKFPEPQLQVLYGGQK